MDVQPLPDRWTDDASYLAQAIDPQNRLIRLVRMDEAAYRAASFLDDRMMHPGIEARICALDEAMIMAAGLSRDDARWIFHIGHVGSTLVARLLGELENVLSIREPRSLRDLSAIGVEERTGMAFSLRRLMARTFRPEQVALIKATSFVSETAPLLVAPGVSSLFLYATPRNYIASILAGENSLKELAARNSARSDRLRRKGVELIGFDRSDAHRAALAWASEMTSLESAAEAMNDRRVFWADFDRMLTDMAGWIGRCAAEFGFAARQERINEIIAGPLMRRYSKALEYDYSPALRAELLADAASLHAPDIDAAMADLSSMAKSAPLLARALDRAKRES